MACLGKCSEDGVGRAKNIRDVTIKEGFGDGLSWQRFQGWQISSSFFSCAWVLTKVLRKASETESRIASKVVCLGKSSEGGSSHFFL